jgi:hypothetical protein
LRSPSHSSTPLIFTTYLFHTLVLRRSQTHLTLQLTLFNECIPVCLLRTYTRVSYPLAFVSSSTASYPFLPFFPFPSSRHMSPLRLCVPLSISSPLFSSPVFSLSLMRLLHAIRFDAMRFRLVKRLARRIVRATPNGRLHKEK